MAVTRASSGLFLFLFLLSCVGGSTTQTSPTEDDPSGGGGLTEQDSSGLSAGNQNPVTDGNGTTRADCLIDTELGLIAVGSAGGLIVCLLLATTVLACQVCHIQRRLHHHGPPRAPRSRSNVDLVSSAAGGNYWDADRLGEEGEGEGGVVGPCDASVVQLEEVRAERGGEREEEEEEERRSEGGPGPEGGAMLMPLLDQDQEDGPMPEVMPRDLEDMPLVV